MKNLLILSASAAALCFLAGCEDEPYYGHVAYADHGYYDGGYRGYGYGPDVDFYYEGGHPYSHQYGPLVYRDNGYYYSHGGSYVVYDRGSEARYHGHHGDEGDHQHVQVVHGVQQQYRGEGTVATNHVIVHQGQTTSHYHYPAQQQVVRGGVVQTTVVHKKDHHDHDDHDHD